ncbi:MAG TPA: hypothetical protein VF159_11740 [Gemmatimonadaceae bacterium]
MYSTCIFCQQSLGSNEAVEHFPVGRRLAFDAAKGRLWVVCRKCERWNLTPLEERWEAIEECERLFSGTRLRVSTDNIGLARVADGLELVRVGSPQLPEMAAWRYGDQFGRRRRRHLVFTGAVIVTAAGVAGAGLATGVIAGSSLSIYNLAQNGAQAYRKRKVRARIKLPGQNVPALVRQKHLNQVQVLSDEHGWGLRVVHDWALSGPATLTVGRMLGPLPWYRPRLKETDIVLRGDDAVRVAAKLLPALNATGAKSSEIAAAVELMVETPNANALLARIAGRPPTRVQRLMNDKAHNLALLPREFRLALEMATHEDSERRALDGELALLEEAWREAEEIAAIADDMFVSPEASDTLARLRREQGSAD